MSSTIFFDDRWVGDHGIGRVATSLAHRLKLEKLLLPGSPVNPVDSAIFFLKTLYLPANAIVFSPGYNAPMFIVRPFVFIVHDLNHIDRDDNSSLLKRLYYQIILKRGCQSAIRILTVSEFSKSRIAAWAQVDPDKIVNIKNGVDECFTINGDVFLPGFPYLLTVSNRKKHKNERNILRALSIAKISDGIKLIFTGAPTPSLERFIRELGLFDRVVFIGRVPEDDLPKLYRGALALVFPSLYEGFGLPVIESMACGTPVLTSNTTSLPEVSGDAALLVDPESVEDIAKGINKIVTDENLRSHLRTLGLARAKNFSWDIVAKRVQNVFDEIDGDLSK